MLDNQLDAVARPPSTQNLSVQRIARATAELFVMPKEQKHILI